MSETADKLMDLAEGHLRHAGYNGFSFLKLGNELGIKTASIHYHFPTKAVMAAAVARRHAERFFAAVESEVGNKAANKTGDPVAVYRTLLRRGLRSEGKMCLFGMLSAEADGLPPEVVSEAEKFFRRCIEDLAKRLGGPKARTRATQIMATLEGALLLARALKEPKIFDEATSNLD